MNYADKEYHIGKNLKQLINLLEFELFFRWVRGFTKHAGMVTFYLVTKGCENMSFMDIL